MIYSSFGRPLRWYDKLLERLHNLCKKCNSNADDSAAPAAKKSKGLSSKQALLKRYPPRLHNDSIEDKDNVEQHKSSMSSEMVKKPREIVLPLSTYSAR